VNDWFDVFNVSVPVSDYRTTNRAYSLSIDEQNQIIDGMSKTMLNIRLKGRNCLLPFQTGKTFNHLFNLTLNVAFL
jgi:hypothetical protein